MYNPFNESIDELTESDLRETLPGKRESWTFEYKGPGKITDGEGIAKSVASFANMYGGWLFIGIDANASNEPQIADVVGIPSEEGCLTERIYQMCNSNLSPSPYVACSVVKLGSGGSVIVVHIPQSPNPPHILMKTGKVYVRSGDTTNPLDVVRDRQKLDRLYDRARENRDRVEALAAAHDGGALLARMVLETCSQNCKNLELHPRAIGAFAIVSYPAVEVAAPLELGWGADPAVDLVKRVGTKVDPHSADTLEEFVRGVCWRRWLDQDRYYGVTDRYRLFYVDHFAHIGIAETVWPNALSNRVGADAVNECMEHLPALCDAAEFVYRDLGYLGPVNVVCRVALPDQGVRAPVGFTAPALELSKIVKGMQRQMQRDLRRVAGLDDQEP